MGAARRMEDQQAAGMAHPEDEDRLVQDVAEQGYCVVPGALGADELATMREAFDADRRAHPRCWELRGSSRDELGLPGTEGPVDAMGEWEVAAQGVGESGRWQSEPLPRTDAFDYCIWHPRVLPLLERLLGPTLRLNGMSAMSRDPVSEPVPPERNGAHWQLFHREEGASFAPDHPFCMRTSMVLFYLDDCDEGSHCFSIVPESLATKKALPHRTDPTSGRTVIDQPFTERMWRNRPVSMLGDEIADGVGRPDAVDILAPAGTAIVTNACNIHAGTVRQSERPRRSIILWWTHGPVDYTPREQKGRPYSQRHNNGHDMALPARLLRHPRWAYLFSSKPLSEEEEWLCLGIRKPQQPLGGPRL